MRWSTSLLGSARTGEEIVVPTACWAHVTRRLLERALVAELTEHLGFSPGR